MKKQVQPYCILVLRSYLYELRRFHVRMGGEWDNPIFPFHPESSEMVIGIKLMGRNGYR